ncbi:uncharacterized protein LOC133178502 [Saccostrea echinata]|uniref:uncharacterized protein LOC133178502 n=1 Tax=Saccostrea echinata TaxID=191078 RepID=UPI002A81F481|nr:uncharacterized protein LOC133178502 [Saccostrea echinata]
MMISRFVVICVLFYFGYSYAAVLRNQRDGETLDKKVSELRDLLNEIKNNNDEKDSSDTVKSESIAKESDMASPKISDKASAQTSLLLSPEEITVLKKLKATLKDEIKQSDEGLKSFEESVKDEKVPVQLGTFLNEPLPEKSVSDTDRLKHLASLMSARSQTEQVEKDGFGRFLDNKSTISSRKNSFRDNLLYVLVDKLLEDTDLLLKKGFSLTDVLNNLSEKAKMERERTALEQTLEKLLDQKNI